MNRLFADDPFLYRTIKEITGFSDSDIEPIFKKLHAQSSWKIADIEEEAKKWN